MPGVQLVLCWVLLHRSEVSDNPHKVLEVNLLLSLALALVEEGVDDPVSERVDGQLWNPEEVLPGQIAMVLLVQTREPCVQTLNLLLGESSLGGDLVDLLLLQLGARVAHLEEAEREVGEGEVGDGEGEGGHEVFSYGLAHLGGCCLDA